MKQEARHPLQDTAGLSTRKRVVMPDLHAQDSSSPESPLGVPSRLNPERLYKVADMIQAYPEHFDMGFFLSRTQGSDSCVPQLIAQADLFECGTSACVAGWACSLWGAEVGPDDYDIDKVAARILGMTTCEAGSMLFYAQALFEAADAAAAADMLRRMALAYEAVQS